MHEYFFSMAVSIILTTIKMAVKNPDHASQVAKALLKIRDAISALYPEETE